MPVRRHQTTNRDIQKLRALAASGCTRLEAVPESGMTIDSIAYWDVKLNLGFALTRSIPRLTTAADLTKLEALAADGDAPVRAVARAIGRDPSWVRFWARKLGLKFPSVVERAGPARIGVIPDTAIQRAVVR